MRYVLRKSWGYTALLCVVMIWSAVDAVAQPLTATGPGIINVRASAVAWGDIDNDGHLDLAIAGLDGTGAAVTKIYKNDGAGGLTEDATHAITGVIWGDLAFGDFDNDGKLDLAISGQGQSSNANPDPAFGISEVYRNVNGVLIRDPSQLIGPPPFFEVKLLRYSSVTWTDFTNDGKLDLLIAGIDRNGFVSTKLYINQNNILTENSSQSVVAIRNGALSWGDFDGDGLPDLAIMGLNDQGLRTTSIYINNNGLLIENTNINLPDIYGGDMAWGDYDGDGNLDLAISGWDEYWRPVLKIYRNNALRGTLEESFALDAAGTGLVGSMAWGDYDSDGDLDLAVSGRNELTALATRVYVNGGATFTAAAEAALIGEMNGTIAWVDANGDRKLDLLVTGEKADGSLSTELYTNGGGANTIPTAPVLSVPLVTSTGITFRWAEGSDTETSAARLTYNLRLGTSSGGNELISAAVIGAAANKGAGPGNIGQTLLKQFAVPVGVNSLFWSVQTVDTGFERSNFATEDTIVIQRFVNSSQQLVGVRQTILGTGAAWGDYDADGFIDLVIAGRDINGDTRTLIYHNENGTLVQDNQSSLNGLMNGALTWGDYDRDGDLDLFRSGEDRFGNGFTFLFKNNNNAFSSDPIQVPISNLNLRQGGGAWGDYNNDGRLDLAVSGLNRTNIKKTLLYRNVPGDTLVEDTSQTITGTANGQLAWGDIDNDGDLDLIISGESAAATFTAIFEIYRNTNGILTRDATQNLTGFFSSALALGDVDNDGDLDLVITGGIVSGGVTVPKAAVFTNDGTGIFTEGQALTGTFGGTVSLGDADNDGDLDLFLTGQDVNSEQVAILYINSSGVFSATTLSVVPGNLFSSAGWADYDNDKDLDLAVTGGTGLTFTEIAQVFDNLTGKETPNSTPNSPPSLNSVSSGSQVTLTWGDGTDSQTSGPALTYALRVGTSSTANDVVSGIIRTGTGPLGHANVTTLKDLPDSTYFWSIRTIDGAFTPSEEAVERQFIIDTTPPSVASVNIDPAIAGIGAVVTVVLNFEEKVGVDNTVNPTVTFTPKNGGTTIPLGQLSYSGTIWTGKVTISASTTSDTMHIGVSGAQDLQGNVMVAAANVGSFIVDTNIPAVTSTIPTDGQKGVTSSIQLQAVFSKALDPNTLSEQTFTLRRTDTGASITGTPAYEAGTNTATFTQSGLDSDVTYEATIGAAVTDAVGNRLSADFRWSFTTAIQVSKASGGRITNDAISLYIPPNAFATEGTEVSIEEVSVDSTTLVTSKFVGVKSLQNITLLGPAVRFTPETETLDAKKPGTLTIKYGSQPGLSSVDESKLAIFRETDTAGTWARIGGTINTQNKTITTVITRLGTYAVFEDAAATGSSVALASFRAQPRVFSPNGNRFNTSEAAISFTLGKSFPVTVEVYNVAGRLERTICRDKVMGPGNMVEMWNGRDNKGRLCPTGLYIVLIDAGGNENKLTLSVLND